MSRPALPLLLALVLVLMAFGAVMVGPFGLSPGEVLRTLVGQGDPQARIVIWNIRLPRVAAALLVGAALAAAGASYQALFRNPLVSPDILGVSAGAGLGAVAGIFLSLPVAAIQASAFVGGMVAVGVVTLVATAVRGLAKVPADDNLAALVANGRVLPRPIEMGDGPWAVFGPDDTLIAVYESFGDGQAKPAVVLPTAQR